MTSLRTLTHESLLPPTLNASSPLLRRPLRLYDMLADNAKEQLGPYLEGEIVTPGSIPCHALQVFLESLCRGRSKSTRIRPAIRAPPVHAVRMIARRVCAQKTRSGSANGWHLTRDKFSVGFGAGDHLGDSSISNRRILLRSARTEHRTPEQHLVVRDAMLLEDALLEDAAAGTCEQRTAKASHAPRIRGAVQ